MAHTVVQSNPEKKKKSTKTKTKTKTKDGRKRGCYISCCMGVCVLVAVLILLGLVALLVHTLAPKGLCSCKVDTEDTQWERCHGLASKRNQCIRSCNVTRDSEILRSTWPESRLNRTLLPTHYNLEIKPEFYLPNEDRFSGSVEIYMKCEKSTDVIVLHAKDLVINSVVLREGDAYGRTIPLVRKAKDRTNQFYKMYPRDNMVAGYNYYLSMAFNGSLFNAESRDPKGFRRAGYFYNGRTRYLAFSQFGRADARRAFPCFDEPFFKATFNVTLVRHHDYTALSNMPLLRTIKRNPQWHADVFQETPRMPSYAVAMVISQYTHVQYTTPSGKKIRIWTQPNYTNYTKFALSVSGPLLETYELWTAIPYPLPKLDQVVVPSLRGSLAGWGLAIYTEAELLYNPKYTTTKDRRRAADAIAQKLAQQWFGNLVTPEWWDDNFLILSFAFYVGDTVGLQSILGNWQIDQFFVREMQEALVPEVASRPVRWANVDPNKDSPHYMEGRKIYFKGAGILRMISYFLSPSTFKRAIQNYLQKFAYSTVTSTDLYESFDRAAQFDRKVSWDGYVINLPNILAMWLDSGNFPLVDVTNYQTNRNSSIMVRQTPFIRPINATDTSSEPHRLRQRLWDIPFTYADKETLIKDQSKLRWIYKDDSAYFPTPGTQGWTMANVFEQGVYRVSYDDDTWRDIVDQLDRNFTIIPVESRSEFVDDAFAIAGEGLMEEVKALTTTRYLEQETEFLPWSPQMMTHVQRYERSFARTSTYALLNKYMLMLVLPNYQRLGWDNSDPNEHLQKYLRVMSLEQACKRNYQPCIDQALTLFKEYRENPAINPITPDFRNFVYCTAITHGGQDEFDFLKLELGQLLKDASDYTGSERDFMIHGLACVREPYLINQYIEYVVSLHRPAWHTFLASNSPAQDSLWTYLDKNWDTLPPSVEESLQELLWELTETYASEKDLKQLNNFFDDHPTGLSADFRGKLLSKVQVHITWMRQNEKPIADWLKTVTNQTPVRTR